MAHAAYLSMRARAHQGGSIEDEVRGASERRAGTQLALSAYRTGISMEDWLWFQSAFYRGARGLVDKRGAKVGKALVAAARKDGNRLTRATLFKRYPEARDWLLASFAAE
jgi:hypothetical protein